MSEPRAGLPCGTRGRPGHLSHETVPGVGGRGLQEGLLQGCRGPWEGLRHRDPQTGPTRWEEQKEVLAGAPAGAEAGEGVVDRI